MEEKIKAKGFALRMQLGWVFTYSWLVGYTM
jgi:hypothetical protein